MQRALLCGIVTPLPSGASSHLLTYAGPLFGSWTPSLQSRLGVATVTALTQPLAAPIALPVHALDEAAAMFVSAKRETVAASAAAAVATSEPGSAAVSVGVPPAPAPFQAFLVPPPVPPAPVVTFAPVAAPVPPPLAQRVDAPLAVSNAATPAAPAVNPWAPQTRQAAPAPVPPPQAQPAPGAQQQGDEDDDMEFPELVAAAPEE